MTIAELVLAYQKAEATIKDCLHQLHTAETYLNTALNRSGPGHLKLRCEHERWSTNLDFEHPADTLNIMKRDVWTTLVAHLELHRALSSRRFKELQQTLENGALPDITEDNVRTFA